MWCGGSSGRRWRSPPLHLRPVTSSTPTRPRSSSSQQLSLVPLAWLIGEATEHAAEHTGPGVGGFLNASFGNAPELIIALFAVADGLPGVVRGSLTGSVVSNILLVLGVAMIAGGDGKVDTRSLRWQLAAVLGTVLLILIPSDSRGMVAHARDTGSSSSRCRLGRAARRLPGDHGAQPADPSRGRAAKPRVRTPGRSGSRLSGSRWRRSPRRSSRRFSCTRSTHSGRPLG